MFLPPDILTTQSHRACPLWWQDPDWVGGKARPLHETSSFTQLNAFCDVRDVLTTPQRFIFFSPVFKYVGIVSQAATGPAWATAGS